MPIRSWFMAPCVAWVLAGALALPGAVLAQQDLIGTPPQERSTPDTIRFSPVDEKQLGKTAIEGALGPSAAGTISEGIETLVEPVYLSEDFRRALDMDQRDLQRQREQLLGPGRALPTVPQQVQFPGFQGRSYSPAANTNTIVRD